MEREPGGAVDEAVLYRAVGGEAGIRVIVDALEMGRVPAAEEVELRRPRRRAAAHQSDHFDESGPVLGRGRRRPEAFQRLA